MYSNRTTMRLSIVMFLIFFCAGFLSAQEKTAADFPKNVPTKKFIQMIAGTWKLEQIVDAAKSDKPTANTPESKSNSSKELPAADTDQSRNAMQMLEFENDARYKVNNSTTAIDSGSYRINEQTGVLYLESDSDDLTASEWGMTLSKNVLTLEGRGDRADSRYKYVYSREKKETASAK